MGNGERGGLFRWDSTDRSTATGDEFVSVEANGTNRGVFFPPDSDATGASGGFFRLQYFEDSSAIFTEWFGAVRDGATSDSTAFDDAVRFVDGLNQLSAGVDYGAFQYGFPEIRLKHGIYELAAAVTFPNGAVNVGFVGPRTAGAFVQTSADIPALFRCGLDVTGGGVQGGTIVSNSFTRFENIWFRSNNLTSTTVCIQFPWNSTWRINNCAFRDFYVSVDIYAGQGNGTGNHFYSGGRTAANPVLAHWRFQGFEFDTGVLYLPSNISLIDNECVGKNSDPTSLQNIYLVHAIDGLYIKDRHANFSDTEYTSPRMAVLRRTA